MKKKNYTYVLLFAFLLTANFAKATVIIIQAMGSSSAPPEQFVPQVANAVCGDTIKWVLVSGTHTTASTTIPAGAAAWSSPNITASGYTRVLTVPGTYHYTCHPATGGHMDATIVVTCSSAGISSVPNIEPVSIYPNPSSGKIMIEMGTASKGILDLYNVSGEKVFQSEIISSTSEADLNLSKGVYFYMIRNEKIIIGKGKLVIE